MDIEQIKTPRQVITECRRLQDFWKSRDSRVKDWYNILLMEDEFKEENLESFVGNDPRTFFNMSVHLLCDKVPHRIPTDELSPEEIPIAVTIEAYIEHAWKDIDVAYRNVGKQNFLKNLVGLMLATGWYAVFAYIDTVKGFVCDAWSPIEAYPEWDEIGLSTCARIYTMNKDKAKRYVAVNKLTYNKPILGDISLYNLWWFEGDVVMNSIVIGEDFVKPPSAEPFTRIPIFISPVAGLPDTGIIKSGEEWKAHYGESIFATNEYVYRSYNKQWTFSSQLLRDTAQPRWFEKSSTGDILKPSDMFKRGAIFKGGLQDSIEALQVPMMPVELRTDRFDMQNMIQRGGLPWAMSGNVQGDMSGYLMAQISSAAMETLGPYHEAVKHCMTDIDNFWLSEMKLHGYNPYNVKKLKVLDTFRMEADYSMKIPGDLVQRATVAKMLNPNYQMSMNTITVALFPEIKNPMKEQAAARRDLAMNSPMSIQINTIIAYRQMALDLRNAGDPQQADLFEKAATFLENQLFPQQQPMPNQTGQPMPPGAPTSPQQDTASMMAQLMPPQPAGVASQPRPEAMPRQAMQNVPGLPPGI